MKLGPKGNMAQEQDIRSIPEKGIVDRSTGREADEFSVDETMSLKEKLDRYEAAEVELTRADAYLQSGVNKAELYGALRDVQDAIELLTETATYHADSFTPEQLKQAAEERLAIPGLLQAIADRRSAPERNSANNSLSDRMRATDETRDVRQVREDDRARDQGRDEKG